MKLITANLLNRFWTNGVKPILTKLTQHEGLSGSADKAGHVKLSDTYNSLLSGVTGVAASQKAVAEAYEILERRTNICIETNNIIGHGGIQYTITLSKEPSANGVAIGSIVGGAGIGSVGGLRRVNNTGATCSVHFVNALPVNQNVNVCIWYPI